MHYYKRSIGDYAKKAGRLSMLQHGAYTLLIDSCYDREQFPTLDEAMDWTWASTDVEIEAVKFILRKFFVLEDGVYVQKRIKEELNEYRAKAEINSRIAQQREEKRRERERTVNEPLRKSNEPPPNHKPITNNQLTIDKEKNTKKENLANASPTKADGLISQTQISEPIDPLYPTLAKKTKGQLAKSVVKIKTFNAEQAVGGMAMPHNVDREVFRAWIRSRAAIKKPISTQEQMDAVCKKLSDIEERGYNANSVITDSIAMGYQGLFPNQSHLRNATSPSSTEPQKGRLEARNDYVLEQFLKDKIQKGEVA